MAFLVVPNLSIIDYMFYVYYKHKNGLDKL